MRGKLYGVGVGPGDPELITIKAKNILENVNIIAVPKTAREKESVAWKIAAGIIGSEKEIIELEFPMSYDGKLLSSSWEAAAQVVTDKLEQGFDVAFVTLGDPTVYSTYIYLHKLIIGRGFDGEIVPGVTSFCASAAKAGISLAEGKETVAIVPSSYENNKLSEILDNFDNIILMKAAKSIKELSTILNNKGLDKNSVVVNNCGLDNESLEYELESERTKSFGYFTTVIVKKSGVR